MVHSLSLVFEYIGLWAVSIFMLNLVYTAYQQSKKAQLVLPVTTYLLYTIKYSVGIKALDLFSMHHAIWELVVFVMIYLIKKDKPLQVLLYYVFIVIVILLFKTLPDQFIFGSYKITLYGVVWVIGATAFLIQKVTLIRRKTFVGLSFVSMTGFGIMHLCATAFFYEKNDLVSVIAHSVYTFAHFILFYFMVKYKN